jgi:hypothetical protein
VANRGRPTKYTKALAERICERLAAGETLLSICRDENFPKESTVRGWALKDVNGFYAKYTRARDIGLDSMADRTIEISDAERIGEKVKRTATKERHCSKCDRTLKWQGGWIHADTKDPICDQAKAEVVYEMEATTGDMVERSKLQVETRKWYLSKLAPRRYGDRPAPPDDAKDDEMLKQLADAIRNSPHT